MKSQRDIVTGWKRRLRLTSPFFAASSASGCSQSIWFVISDESQLPQGDIQGVHPLYVRGYTRDTRPLFVRKLWPE
jgi:hypothetical protein